MNKKYFIINVNNSSLLVIHNNYIITNIDMVFNKDDYKDLIKETDQEYIKLIESEFSNYFNKKSKSFNFDFKLNGTNFQKDVWNYLLTIPYGEVRNYEDIAVALGNKNKVRAVGNAVGKNPIIIVVPCHRIIRKDKTLGGFSSGIENKILLHNIEGIKI